MNRAEKRRQKKLAKKAASNAKLGKATIPSPGQQTPTIQQSLELAVRHHNAGDLAKAEGIYQQVLQVDPNQPVALHLLGLIAHQEGNHDAAVEFITKALVIKPDYAEAHSNLGNALRDLGKLDEAVASYQKGLALKPNLAEIHYNLGTLYQDLDKLDEAVASYQKVLTITPDHAKAYNNLGNALKKQGKLDEAIASYRQAVTIKPDYATAHNNLGTALEYLGLFDEAEAHYLKALAILPDFAETHNNLGNVLRKLGRTDEAVASYQKALAIKPDSAGVLNNFGNVLKDFGALDEALASFQKALEIKPDYALAHSNLLFSEQYRLGHSAQSFFKLHCEWDEQHGRAFISDWPAHQNNRDPERRLKIGFVSPDLGYHPVGFFVLPLLENLGKHEIQTVCFSDRIEDDLTKRVKAVANVWRDVYGVSDEDLSQMIVADGIDILFDLAGHTAKNRLQVFARKPSPIQITWAGYVGTTGLEAMDYLLSDAHYTPVEEHHYYRENIINMPDTYVCYEPPTYAPDVGPLPFAENGFVTFGSFNNPSKINADVLALWGDILDSVPDSRLVLKFKGIDADYNVDRLTSFLTARRLDAARLSLEGMSLHEDLLKRYNNIDIALDTFPYSGGLTTCEALWMGAPVITLPGETFASRHSLSYLSTLGLPELVARDRDDYVKLAVELAIDPDRLAGLRTELRGKMASSPICDSEKFTQGFAMKMQDIWRNWCISQDN